MASADQSTSPVPEADGGSAGEFVLKKLFAEFVAVSERKLQIVCSQPLDYSLAKGLVRGEDAQFDQVLSALNEVSSFCLRSVLTAIFKWRDMQIEQCRSNPDGTALPSSETTDLALSASKKDRVHLVERRELAVEFIFCLVLVEVMPRLSVHPVPESFIHNIEDLAFTHFKLQESLKDHRTSNPIITNMRKIADLYAEVIGVLSQSRFHSVRRRFFLEIRNVDHSSATVISIIEGMSFIRVKMFPVEELEQWFAFLQECAKFFLDCPREKIKAAMSALLVDILLPVAAVINLEASLPVAKKLVSMLYGHCLEHARRARYSNTYIPLATVLLAISEQTFFLNNWHLFLVQNLLPSLKRGDTKIHNIALVSLYRLVWVYMIRIKGESNKTTMLRLRTVLDTLFPRGQRGVNPKEMPLNIFVKLIQFIARERLEYAMQEVILELLSQGKTKTAIYPERMIIGLRAFLMITDSLEKKEGDPPMPINPGPLPSRGVSRVKNRFLSNTLSDETARKIGISQFYPGVQRALDGILRSLDHYVGRQLTSTNPQTGKSVEEILSTVKPKLDLLKTCVAAIPRILPENMNQEYLTDLLSRLTIHLDHELGRAAANSLHTMVTNYPAWRHNIVQVFVQFLLRDVPDSCPLVLEATLKLLIQFLRDWRQLVTSPPEKQTEPAGSGEEGKKGEGGYCIPWVEACGLVTLCSYRSVTRRLSLVLLKEVRSLHEALAGQPNRVEETPVMDVIESATPVIVKRYLSTLSVNQRTELRVANQSLNLTWLADRAACFLEQGGSRAAMRDPWALCLAGLMEPTLLPKACQSATHLAWPYLYHRMVKAYTVLDPGGLVADKGDKPSSMRGKGRPIVSSVETFLWRNYCIFASCSAPSSLNQESSHETTGRPSPTARELFQRVVPLIRWDGEIREVAVTALGLVHPPAFGDLVEQLQPVIHDALEQRKDVKRRRRREALKIQITRVFSLAAEHGCFQHSHAARTEHGQLSPVLLDFIEGIKSHFDIEKEGVHSYPELRLHFAGLIGSIINGVPQGQSRMLLLSAVTRQGLFYLFATWCGLWQRVDVDTWTRNPQISFNSLQAMSALLCCGPVFQTDSLEQNSLLYRWLDNMLNCKEGRVQALGQRTVQLLLANNSNCPTLLHWVVDRCYDNQPGAAQLCFHALATTLETFPDYPCDMVTILHVVLFKTADPEHSVRERAMQLLQLLDSRFLSESGHSRPELLGCLTGGTYSQSHVVFSKELATTNPELTFPLFSEMVYRFEMASHSGQRSILQYMVSWLANMELVEENQTSPYISHSSGHVSWPRPSSAVLQGIGWGSLDGTKLVLHNLLYITAKYGEEHSLEVEGLWSALCSWQNNLRITINYLARLMCACGNMAIMVQHAKRIMVSFSRSHAAAIITELIRDLQSVEIISAELQPSDVPPFYCMSSGQGEGKKEGDGTEGEGWTVRWRSAVRVREGSPVALPVPFNKQHFASLKSLLKLPVRQLVPLHRCNFALMILSELVLELQNEVDWCEHLPLLLHVGLLGLDLMKSHVYEHSKALLGNLVVVVACKDNILAALQAKLVQQEMGLCSSSSCSPLETGDQAETTSPERSLPHQASSSLIEDAQEIIKFISQREGRRPRWPFADISNRSGEVSDLYSLVNKIIRVFSHAGPSELKEKWARKALNWATSCSSHQYASQSFQVCRALQLPLSAPMFREILTRLAESAADTNEDMQSYVLEIVLTLECALAHLPLTDEDSTTSLLEGGSVQMTSEPSQAAAAECPLSPPSSTDSVRRHHRVRSITSKQDMVPQRPVSVHGQMQPAVPVVVTPLPSISSQTSADRPAAADGWKELAEKPELKEEVEESSAPPSEPTLEELKGRIRMKITPLSTTEDMYIPGGVQKATAAEHFHAYSDTAALSSSEETSQETGESSRLRKGSEPPPSLMALFEGGKKTYKQQSYDEESIHPKQHSLDNSHLSTSQPHGSPRHRRRMRSPVLSNKEMERAPSHPHLHQTTSTPHFPHSLSTQPLTKASSIQQLRAASPLDVEDSRNHRSYSGGKEDMKRLKLPKLQRQEQNVQNSSKESLLSSNTSSVGSLKTREMEKEAGMESSGRVVNKRLMSIDSVPMRSSAKSSSDMWRRNSSQIGIRREMVSGGRGGVRPHSMVETSTLRPYYPLDWNPTPSTLVAQMFWTAVSLLESNFEAEFSMALRLISKSLEKLDLSLPESWESLQNLLPKLKWPNFPGVQALLMKGLTLDNVAQDTRSLLVLITPFSTKLIFDPSQYGGLPLNIMALMPLLVHHFSSPTPFCLKAVSNIRQACEAIEMLSEESKLKLQHMSRMFQMYSEGEFSTGCDIWLAGICRYLNEAYPSLAVPMLTLLSKMLEQGPDIYHRPVLRLLYEYLRLQEPLAHRMQGLVNSTMVVVHRHLAGPLWREAVDLLKLVVASSAALVQPPTRGLPVDLGLIHHTLPGPTLQFKMDLQPNSRDLGLAHEPLVQCCWKNPAASQRCTRERLLSVINACIPIPVLMSSPSVVFTDEQTLMEKATSASEEASSSLASVPGDLSSQPEAQSLIADEFNFLDNMEYIYDSSSESETPPGPFSRPGEEEEVGEEEEEEEESLSDLETLPLELSMSDLERSDALSHSPESSLPSLSYEPQSLSNQIQALGQSGDTLPEEEEPLPEEPLPFIAGPLHQHESSHTSTLTGDSPESHEEAPESTHFLEKASSGNEDWSGMPVAKAQDYPESKQGIATFYEASASEGGQSDSESSRDSSFLANETELKDTRNQKLVGLEDKLPADSRWQSEPPEESRLKAEAPAESRGHSEPPPQSSKLSVEGSWLYERQGGGQSDNPAAAGFREPPADARQLSEPPTDSRRQLEASKDVRGESEPPPDVRGKEPSAISWLDNRTLEQRISEPPVKSEMYPETTAKSNVDEPSTNSKTAEALVESNTDEPTVKPSVESNTDEPTVKPSVESNTDEQPSVESNTNEQPSVESNNNEQPSVESNTNEQPSVESNTNEQPSVESNTNEQPSVESNTNEQPSVESNNNEQPSVESNTNEQPSVESNNNEQPSVESNTDEPNANEPSAEPSVEKNTDKIPAESSSLNETIKTAVESNDNVPTGDSYALGEERELSKWQEEGQPKPVLEPKELSKVVADGRHLSEPPPEGQNLDDKAEGRAVSEPPVSRSSEDLSTLNKKATFSEPIEEKQSSNEHNAPSDEVKDEDGSLGEVKLSSSPPLGLEASSDAAHEPSEWVVVEQVDAQEKKSVEEQTVDFPSVQPFQSATSRFILVSNEEIVDVWKRHVASLGCDKPEQQAVHTHFLFVRLFPVLRQQFAVLTREACNYLGHSYSTIAAHFLVTVELLVSQFQLPSVYIDSELLVKAKLVESHVFLTLELDGNIDVYFERRRTVLQRLELIKLQLRQQSKDGNSQEKVEIVSLSPEQATLQLCQAVHRLHFQLLVLLGSYIKLLHSLQPYLATCGGVEMSQELAEVQTGVEESVQLLGRVPSPLLEQIPAAQPVAEALQLLEDTLTQKQWSRAVQLLRAVRRQNRDVEDFGGSEDDDVDCLFFIYARFLTDNQEGVVCITSGNSELSAVHSRLMAQNVSLHSLLETTHQNLSSP